MTISTWNLFSLFAFFLVAISCNRPNDDRLVIFVEHRQVAQSLAVNDVFSQLEELKLNIPQRESIGNALKLLHFEGYWVLLHQQTGSPEKVVAVINEEGVFEYSIRNKAGDPDSYRLQDITKISENSFAVLDASGRHLYDYDVDGTLLDERIIPFKVVTLQFSQFDNQFIFNRNSRSGNHEDTSLFYNLIFTDIDFNIEYKFFPYEIPVGGRSIINFPDPIIMGDEGEVYFSELFSEEISAFKNGQENSAESIKFDLPGSNKATVGSSLNQMEQVQAKLNNGELVLAGRFNVNPQKGLIYFNLASLESPIFGLSSDFGENLQIARQVIRSDGGVLPYPISYEEEFGFVSLLNENSLEYTPEELITGDLIDDVLKNGSSYLIFSKPE